MAGPPWFYYPFDHLNSEKLELSGVEANHILGARRIHPGDELVLSNGQGRVANCTLLEADKKSRSLILLVSLIAEIEPPQKQIILASALAKGDRLSNLLDMACQLGMTCFQPVHFERSVGKWSDNLAQRCERIVIEACKQSKQAWLPRINAICDYAEIPWGSKEGTVLTLLTDPYGRPMDAFQEEIAQADTLRIVVGPEGGLSDTELSHAQEEGGPKVRLASHILRVETAAVASIAALQAHVVYE